MSDSIEHARRMVDETTRDTVSAWPRAAALLARQHVEAALVGYWERHEPLLARLSMRVQLACLRVYARDEAVAADVAWVWHALSRATHHRPYELDPTREELISLINDADRLAQTLSEQRDSRRGL